MLVARNKRLLYVINHIDWFWSHRLPLAQGAQKNDWDVSVAVTGSDSDSRFAQNSFRNYELPASDQGFAPFTLFKIALSIYKVLKVERPDLVHVITLKYAFIAGLVLRFYKNTKVIHTIAGLGYLFSGEGLKPKLLRFFIGPFLRLALRHKRAHIIFQNPDDLNLMVKRGFVEPSQCHLIRGSGVDLNLFPFVNEPVTDIPIVLMPTRLVHDKGVAVFIEAAKILKEQGINARFQIAGGITLNNPLAISKSEMESMILGSPVEWLGLVSDMSSLYAACSLICYPSYYGEGIPKVLLEATAIGRAIITTDHPGCREAVEDGKNGILVPIKDASATAMAIKELLLDGNRCKNMGFHGRKRAEENFDVRKIVQETLAVYDAALTS